MTDVASLLRARAARGGAPPHDDGARVVLCIEGGAMRGVVAAGMVAALEELGLTRAFDAVYGSSAGAICGAYFLAGQAALGARIYSEDINNARFASTWRLLSGRPIVNLDFLVTEVMVDTKPLDCAAVIASATPLSVLATDVEAGAPALLTRFADGDDLRAALRAGATMPIVAGGPFRFRNRRYFDASLTEPIPLPSADVDSCTHIVVLLTRPRGIPRDVSPIDRWIIAPRLARISRPLAALYLNRTAPYSAVQDQIATGRSPSGRAAVLGIRPDIVLSKFEKNRARLLDGAASGRRAVLAALGG